MGGRRLIEKAHAKKILGKTLSSKGLHNLAVSGNRHIPKGYVCVYVGQDSKKRFVIPIIYLNHALFKDLLHVVEEEFGFEHPMGGLTIPCSEDYFLRLLTLISDNS